MLLTVTIVHAAVTSDATAFVVAFILFSNTCGKDIVKFWNNLISKNYETDR